jgi:hypothetical protein
MQPGSSKEVRKSVGVGLCRDFHRSRFAEDCQAHAYEKVLGVALKRKEDSEEAAASKRQEPVYQGGEAA